MPPDTMCGFGGTKDKLMVISGQFTSTIKISTSIVTVTSLMEGMSVDSANAGVGSTAFPDKIFYLSGQYSSFIKSELDVSGQTSSPRDITIDDISFGLTETGVGFSKLYRYSGKITSFIKHSIQVDLIGIEGFGFIDGISFENTDTLIMADAINLEKILLVSGKFSSVVHASEVLNGFVLQPRECTFTNPDVMLVDDQANRFYKFSGQFTTGIKSQLDIISIDSNPRGICHDSLTERIAGSFIVGTAANTISFSGAGVFQNIFVGLSFSSVIFTHSTSPIQVNINETISFGQTLAPTVVLNRSVTHVLDFQDQARTTLPGSASNTISFAGTTAQIEGPGNAIAFTDAVGVAVAKEGSGTLSFSGAVVLHFTVTKTTVGAIAFQDFAVAYKSVVDEHEYCPQPGPATIAPARSIRANITLQDNLVTPVNTITIRNPIFGNSDTVQVARALNITRSRHKGIFRDDDWPSFRRLTFTSDENTQTDANNLLNFLSNTLGEEIKLLDWENRSWQGVVVNPDSAVREVGRTCRFTFNIIFEGILIGVAPFEVSADLNFIQQVLAERFSVG